MKSGLPILILVPHAGRSVPDELAGYEILGDFELFFESDACADVLFDFGDSVAARIDSQINRLFVDLDRHHLSLAPRTDDGVVKKRTSSGVPIYPPGVFPDEIAINNLLMRYYHGFHQTVEKILESGRVRLVLDCHTMMAVGPKHAADPGRPRPIVTVSNTVMDRGEPVRTCPDETARGLLESMRKSLGSEEWTVGEPFALNSPRFDGHIMLRHGRGKIPLLRLSVSRALFINDRYFRHDDLSVNNVRMLDLRRRIWQGIERFYRRYF
ncbi:MAG TPA: N-formylglutamate amidohydrolase [Spirochaetota bacterium]|jgi:formiminoglutamase|nr:N-formylglutamate amidohydrolase [Spirochaetota bacterium]OPZ38883.1 MAG: N-formylglutamate amidohydrolase [Spirochaetes bacterium ADurb.BinA120]HNU91275.1 N-formylglutamate amidohydrolase [Spirochaetota bacterium]HPI13935.1 N-formylglutamate amidohydrolase [Spirochaetota bacterium]HPO44451.1 N-formylglutamate amidohydrolase [Spirochaetota bacterium]